MFQGRFLRGVAFCSSVISGQSLHLLIQSEICYLAKTCEDPKSRGLRFRGRSGGYLFQIYQSRQKGLGYSLEAFLQFIQKILNFSGLLSSKVWEFWMMELRDECSKTLIYQHQASFPFWGNFFYILSPFLYRLTSHPC